MRPAREKAGADTPFPPIKETRPLPFRDAGALRTQIDEREVQTMNPYNQTNNLAEVSRYESIR